jgi:hypothetical protein
MRTIHHDTIVIFSLAISGQTIRKGYYSHQNRRRSDPTCNLISLKHIGDNVFLSFNDAEWVTCRIGFTCFVTFWVLDYDRRIFSGQFRRVRISAGASVTSTVTPHHDGPDSDATPPESPQPHIFGLIPVVTYSCNSTRFTLVCPTDIDKLGSRLCIY